MIQADDNKPFIVQEEKAYRERKKMLFSEIYCVGYGVTRCT